MYRALDAYVKKSNKSIRLVVPYLMEDKSMIARHEWHVGKVHIISMPRYDSSLANIFSLSLSLLPPPTCSNVGRLRFPSELKHSHERPPLSKNCRPAPGLADRRWLLRYLLTCPSTNAWKLWLSSHLDRGIAQSRATSPFVWELESRIDETAFAR